MLWVISLAGIFCPGATKRGRWPELDPGKLGHSLSPPPFGFSPWGLSWGQGINGQVCEVSRGQIKEKTRSFPFVMQS